MRHPLDGDARWGRAATIASANATGANSSGEEGCGQEVSQEAGIQEEVEQSSGREAIGPPFVTRKRSGELLGLTWRAVDFDRGSVSVLGFPPADLDGESSSSWNQRHLAADE